MPVKEIEQPANSVFEEYATNPYPDIYKQGLEKLKTLADDTDVWEFSAEKEEVNLYTYYEGGAPVPTVRGDGSIEGYTVEEILAVVHQPKCREVWDVRYDKGFPLERYSRGILKFYAAQKGTGYLVWPRDFTGISGHVQEKDGDDLISYYLQKSASFDDVPDVEGHVRGTLEVAGWIFRPGEEPNTVDATYIVKVDPAGSIPSSVVAMVATETPLCVAKVRDYMKAHGFPPYIPQHSAEFPGVLQREAFENDSIDIEWKPSGAGSFDVFYDKKHWSGAKAAVQAGTTESEVKFTPGDGKITVTADASAKGKNLHIVVSKA